VDKNTTNKRQANGSETLNHQLMIKHVIGLFRDTMPFNQLLGLEFVTEGEGLETQVSLHLDWQPALTGNPMQKNPTRRCNSDYARHHWGVSFNCRNHQTNRT